MGRLIVYWYYDKKPMVIVKRLLKWSQERELKFVVHYDDNLLQFLLDEV